MNKVDISVIIPAYNREGYIGKCIESVLSQKDIYSEIIITDDGSTDKTFTACQEYADKYPNIKVIHQENKGLASSRNAALDIATGDYITFLDSDDYIMQDAFVRMLNAIRENDVDVVIGGFDRVEENGHLIERHSIPDDYRNRKTNAKAFWELNSRKESNYLCTVVWCKLYKKSVWETLRFGEGIRFAEDEYILPDLIDRCNTFFFLDYIVYAQTNSLGSLSRSEFDYKKLGSPDSKIQTCRYLIRQGYYDFAIEKWGIAVGEIILMTKLVSDDNSRKKLNKLSAETRKIGRFLFKYMEFSKKIKFIAYHFGYPFYALLFNCCKNTQKN